MWDLESGECTKTLKGHTDWVNNVAISPDGRTVVSGSNDNTVRWGVELRGSYVEAMLRCAVLRCVVLCCGAQLLGRCAMLCSASEAA